MAETDPVRLSAGQLELTLNPSVGGSISSFDFADDRGRTGLLRKCNSHEESVLAMGSFPLVPYVNDFQKLIPTMMGSREMLAMPSTMAWVSPARVTR